MESMGDVHKNTPTMPGTVTKAAQSMSMGFGECMATAKGNMNSNTPVMPGKVMASSATMSSGFSGMMSGMGGTRKEMLAPHKPEPMKKSPGAV